MAVAQAIFTEHLAHVLREAVLQQRSGVLRIEYVGEQSIEKGEIVFQQGRTLSAHTDHGTGEAALLRIAGWGRAYYSFTPTEWSAAEQPKRRDPNTTPIRLAAITNIPTVLLQTMHVTPHETPVPTISAHEIAQLGVYAIFRANPTALKNNVLQHLGRAERCTLLLLDGKRNIRNIAQMVHKSELDVAKMVAYLLKKGYVTSTS